MRGSRTLETSPSIRMTPSSSFTCRGWEAEDFVGAKARPDARKEAESEERNGGGVIGFDERHQVFGSRRRKGHRGGAAINRAT